MFFGYGYYSYIIFMLPAIIITIFAQISVNSTFKKYSKITCFSGMSGADAAKEIINKNGLSTTIEHISGNLNDHYDPRTNVIRLSDATYSSQSVAALGVAAHEAGHAVQHSKGYFPIKIRSAIVPICNFGARFAPLFILIGLFFNNSYLYLVGIFGFILLLLFQIVTLPVEFNASSRALKALSVSGTLSHSELKMARKVLTAAALTYVAAMLTSLLQVLYYITRFSGNRRR